MTPKVWINHPDLDRTIRSSIVHSQLAETLFEKKLFTTGMEIVGTYQAMSLGNVNTIETNGTYTIHSISRCQDGGLAFAARSVEDGHIRAFLAENIVSIDGMTPTRFASVHSIAPDGLLKRVGNRRGRKPKVR